MRGATTVAAQQFAGEADVFGRVGGPRLKQDPVRRDAEGDGLVRVHFGFGFVPVGGEEVTLVGHAAGADERAPETLVIEAGGKAGDAKVVSAEDDDYVGGNGVVLELEIVPDDAGGRQGGLVHLVSLSQDGGEIPRDFVRQATTDIEGLTYSIVKPTMALLKQSA